MSATRKRKRSPRAYAPEGFTQKPDRPCLDCLLRDDLDLMARPRRDRYGRISDCEGCGGTGKVKRENPIDPMFTGRGI